MIWSYYFESKSNILDTEYREEFSKINKWIEENDLNSISTGKHVIDGDNLYVNIAQYDVKDETDCIWEAHKQYLDLHFIIFGQETIGISNVENMIIGEYEEDKDYVHVDGSPDAKITCKTGSLLLLYPEDAHKTAIKTSESCCIKKGIFKIRIHR